MIRHLVDSKINTLSTPLTSIVPDIVQTSADTWSYWPYVIAGGLLILLCVCICVGSSGPGSMGSFGSTSVETVKHISNSTNSCNNSSGGRISTGLNNASQTLSAENISEALLPPPSLSNDLSQSAISGIVASDSGSGEVINLAVGLNNVPQTPSAENISEALLPTSSLSNDLPQSDISAIVVSDKSGGEAINLVAGLNNVSEPSSAENIAEGLLHISSVGNDLSQSVVSSIGSSDSGKSEVLNLRADSNGSSQLESYDDMAETLVHSASSNTESATVNDIADKVSDLLTGSTQIEQSTAHAIDVSVVSDGLLQGSGPQTTQFEPLITTVDAVNAVCTRIGKKKFQDYTGLSISKNGNTIAVTNESKSIRLDVKHEYIPNEPYTLPPAGPISESGTEFMKGTTAQDVAFAAVEKTDAVAMTDFFMSLGS